MGPDHRLSLRRRVLAALARGPHDGSTVRRSLGTPAYREMMRMRDDGLVARDTTGARSARTTLAEYRLTPAGLDAARTTE